MLVPRSFKYSSPPAAAPAIDHKLKLHNTITTSRHQPPATPLTSQRSHALSRPSTPPQPTEQASEHTMRPPSQPVDVPSPERLRASGSKTVGHAKGRTASAGRRKQTMPDQHRPEALSPSVAALLAMTTIPRRPRQSQRKSSRQRQVSIDELVNEWRCDDSLVKSYESSPLSILLENADDSEDARSCSLQSGAISSYER